MRDQQKMTHSIPCPHVGLEGDDLPTLSDYHPLSQAEVFALLQEAYRIGGPAADIQVRLNQGVPGIMCPRQIDGPVSYAVNKIDGLFVRFLRRNQPPTEDLAEAVMSIYASAA